MTDMEAMKRILLVITNLLLLSSFSQAAIESSKDPMLIADKKANNTGTEDILFADYKLFMFYTRDSIMRQILSEELEDFCISYASQYNCICLDWIIPINLNHDEITEILSNYAEYGDHFNFLIKENDEYYVDITYLIYRFERSDTNGVLLFPDFSRLDPQILEKIDFRFDTENTWNESLDKEVINKLLSPQQIKAYRDWNSKIDLKKAKKMTRSKIIRPGYSNVYGT
jgi:hypothetical protein